MKNKTQVNETIYGKYVLELKEKHNITPALKWYIIKSLPPYSNNAKSCMVCLHEKFEISTYPNQQDLVNKESELVSKCGHVNKYTLCNYKANDSHFF